MTLLHGLVAPPGDGMIIEIHLDILEAAQPFLDRLKTLGFENDPFLEFYPADYKFHYTGRTRARQSDVNALMATIRALIAQIVTEARDADVSLYVESELVRAVHHFDENHSSRSRAGLDDFTFGRSPEGVSVKADIHVEFRAGTVPENVRAMLVEKCFYWVKTPATQAFPSEEIATLQTSSFRMAQMVYERLVANPPPACTGIHLEQKLAMVGSHAGLPMPPVIEVMRAAPSTARTEGKLIAADQV